jgi:hypothetical protein
MTIAILKIPFIYILILILVFTKAIFAITTQALGNSNRGDHTDQENEKDPAKHNLSLYEGRFIPVAGKYPMAGILLPQQWGIAGIKNAARKGGML